jgi:hypothetical protein
MSDLLEYVVDAHGGLDTWNRLEKVQGQFSIGGAIWVFKGVPDVLRDVAITADLHTERISIGPISGEPKRSVFAGHRLELRSDTDAVIETRDDPRQAMGELPYDAKWDALHAAYFASEAWWTYLTAPFLFTYPGFHAEEVEPFHENGTSYRTLKVSFPPDVDSHTSEQFFHYREDGLLHRHTYTVDILNGATGANYPSDFHTVDGIAVPFTRRIYGYDDDGQKVPEPLLVSLDVHEVRFS